MSLVYEGKVKRVLADTQSPERVVIEFTDRITAGDGLKRETLIGKGEATCEISEFLFDYLRSKGVETHFIKRIDKNRLLCHKVKILPVEAVCRNIAAGSFCRRYGIERGRVLSPPLVEFFLKDDRLHDPLIVPSAVTTLGLASEEEVEYMRRTTLAVNHYLRTLMEQAGLVLVDFKLEFGRTTDGRLLLADEISGDTMRIWDRTAGSLDKDLFREDTGDVVRAYREVIERLKRTDPSSVRVHDEQIQVLVMPKDGIKNPTGEVAKKALNRLGFDEVIDVRAGKVYDIRVSRTISSETLGRVRQMCAKLLANPIAEKTRVRIE